MAQLIVRNLDDEIKDRLAERARQHGRSMEEEVRNVLREAVTPYQAAPTVGLGSQLAELFRDCPFEIEVPSGGDWARPVDFGDDDAIVAP